MSDDYGYAAERARQAGEMPYPRVTPQPDKPESLVKRWLDLAARVSGEVHFDDCTREVAVGGYRMTPCACSERAARLEGPSE